MSSWRGPLGHVQLRRSWDLPFGQRGRWPAHTLLTQVLILTLSFGPCPQVVVLNGCSSIFSSLVMVLCDPGGKLAAFLACGQGHLGTGLWKRRVLRSFPQVQATLSCQRHHFWELGGVKVLIKYGRNMWQFSKR